MNTSTIKNDFPVWLPPAVIKEIRQGLRSTPFTLSLVLFPMAMALLFTFGFITNQKGEAFVSSSVISGIFWGILSFALLSVIPLMAIQSVKNEINSRTADLLVLTKLTPWRIVWGKWSSYMAQGMLIICSLLPFAFFRYFYGSVNLVNDFYWGSLLITCSMALTALAVWLSGAHGFIRTLFTIATVVLSFIAIGMIMNIEPADSGDNEPWFYFGELIYFFLACCPILLVLAARWLALPTSNTSKRLRLLMLLFALPYVVFALIGTSIEDSYGLSYTVLSGWTVSLMIALELTNPQPFLPAHVARKGNWFAGLFKNIFFVPGFFSAAMFSLLLVSAITGIFFLIGFDEQKWTMAAIAIFNLTGWANMVLPAFFILPFRKRLGHATTIVYLAVCTLLFILGSVFKFMNLDIIAMLIPWGNLGVTNYLVTEKSDALASTSPHAIIFLLFILIALICVLISMKDWRKTLKQASELPYLDNQP